MGDIGIALETFITGASVANCTLAAGAVVALADSASCFLGALVIGAVAAISRLYAVADDLPLQPNGHLQLQCRLVILICWCRVGSEPDMLEPPLLREEHASGEPHLV